MTADILHRCYDYALSKDSINSCSLHPEIRDGAVKKLPTFWHSWTHWLLQYLDRCSGYVNLLGLKFIILSYPIYTTTAYPIPFYTLNHFCIFFSFPNSNGEYWIWIIRFYKVYKALKRTMNIIFLFLLKRFYET